MLLTGDARGDHVLAGLEANGLLDDDGRIHVDLLKLPHHGSKNNVKKEFFERVTADHYVVSGDRGRFPNPAREAMEWLHEARGDDDYTVHCTYEIEDMRALFGNRLVTPQADGRSVTAALE
jgi:beta-lactamase superfamily II metal-dependent hydrolase